MPSIIDVVSALGQAAANAYDGATDSEGKPIKVGLKREEEVLITDRRLVDGFKIKLHGNQLCVVYQGEILLADLHKKDFESDIEHMIENCASFLKKEYKKLTKSALTLTAVKDSFKAITQNLSRVRTWVEASKYYTVGNLDSVEPISEPSEEKLDKSIKKWLDQKTDKKPENVKSKKRDEEPPTFMPWNQSKSKKS